MKLKQSLVLATMTFALLLSANSQAGRQGINFYYGLGLGTALYTDSDITSDVMPTGELLFGIEEDGWALEGIGFGGLELNSDPLSIDGYNLGIAYRTIERRNSWFKFKVSKTNIDVNEDNGSRIEASGYSYAVGWGMRINRGTRLEFDYSFFTASRLNGSVHMIIGKFFWGGSKYQGKSF